MSEPVSVEASGETVGEAKWNALRELELLVAGLERSAVEFEVLSEGRRGLLGVGYEPARVLATAAGSERSSRSAPGEASSPADPPERLHDLLERVAAAIAVRCRVEVDERDGALTGTYVGDDLGRLIGRHGQTLDAIQLLASAILQRGEADRLQVVVDAAGYRDRRRRRLEELAQSSAAEVIRSGRRVELEPMSASERKLVHTCLQDHAGVRTASEGVEPHRRVVVDPA